jgi:hypothetical protein
LIIRGEFSDSIVGEEWQKTKKEYFEQAELVTVSRAGYFVHVDNPRAPF